ncbi:MAG: undecaprenyl-diphosphate phosphatase [bacterium]|nr:undecaprenyl-diphosphate phosphatase [bacterium]
MNDILVSVILGIVEGITEFLPVSSTGHLILAGHYLKFTGEKANAFDIFIQLGAILAVLGYFRRRLWWLIQSLLGKPGTPDSLPQDIARRFSLGIIIAFIPSAVLGFLFHDSIEDRLFTPKVVAYALIVGGLAILIIERCCQNPKTFVMEHISLQKSFWIGVAQCFSLIPGMSRSASTIMGGLVVGLNREAAAEFSFFLAIPTMFAATLYSLLKILPSLCSADAVIFGTGFIVSFIVAWLVIAGFMAFIKRHNFMVFGWYRIILGLIILILL